MKKEKSLININNGIFSKIIKSIKSFLFKFGDKSKIQSKEKNNTNASVLVLDDFEVLKGIIEGKIEIQKLDKDLKKRLIVICNNRLNEVNQKIEDKDVEIVKMEKIISSLNEL